MWLQEYRHHDTVEITIMYHAGPSSASSNEM